MSAADIPLTKALGILTRPKILKEGIHSPHGLDGKLPSLAEALIEDIDKFNSHICALREQLDKMAEVLVYDDHTLRKHRKKRTNWTYDRLIQTRLSDWKH